mgnify:FL=1
MGRKAKHHFIPKCYLKGFTDGGNNDSQFWGVPINNEKPFPTTPNDACAIRDYYSVEHSDSLVVEDYYANQVEPKIARALSHIRKESTLPSPDEMGHLILLLATLFLRTPSAREMLEAPLRHAKTIVDSS